METIVLAAPACAGRAAPITELAVAFADLLIVGQPIRVVELTGPAHATEALRGADLLIVAAEVADGALPPSMHAAFTPSRALPDRPTGPLAFALTTGAWPADGAAAELLLKPLLRAAGAVCLAPGLHIPATAQAARPLLAAFSRYWRPAVAALAVRTAGVRAPAA